MSERSAEQIRSEIEAERKGLAVDLDVLGGEARKVAVAAGCVLVAAVSLKILWKLR
jgi:hypothetical protein